MLPLMTVTFRFGNNAPKLFSNKLKPTTDESQIYMKKVIYQEPTTKKPRPIMRKPRQTLKLLPMN